LRQDRAQEDAALEQERISSDEEVMDERQARERALANLLRLEREHTDERLFIERARGDDALAARDDFLGMVSHDLRTLWAALRSAQSCSFATPPTATLASALGRRQRRPSVSWRE
jgi:signal transduction histidine kinase